MMQPVEIWAHLRRDPFLPFRVHLSDGSSYDIRHPEMAMLSLIELAIAIEPTNGDIPERMVYCDPLHVTRIEPLTRKQRKRQSSKKKS